LKNLIGFFRRAVKKPPLVAGLGGILVFLSVMGLRFERGLEFPELAAYDLCIRWQPKNKETDPRIVLIEITEEDIHTLGSWPMTDETVARAMTLLLDLQPAAVGLDLFRDMPVPPGTETLKAVLSRNGPFVAVWKFGDDGVLPPPAVINAEQLGFNDVLVDPGGTVRRGLLFLDNGKDVFYSFSLRLALLFLKSRGIAPAPGIQNPRHLRLGNTTIPPFEPHDGGYRNADARGYQYLLDYRASDSAFRSFTLKELLRGNIRREAIKDKIVLIGVNAQSVKDFFYTPHSRGIAKEQQVPGIRFCVKRPRGAEVPERDSGRWMDPSVEPLWGHHGTVGSFSKEVHRRRIRGHYRHFRDGLFGFFEAVVDPLGPGCSRIPRLRRAYNRLPVKS
jgi:adenylate cyclase